MSKELHNMEMGKDQQISYVDSLNQLYVNKVITRNEFRAVLQEIPLYSSICKNLDE